MIEFQPYPYQSDLVVKGNDILNIYNILYLNLEPRLGKTPISLLIAEIQKVRTVLFVTKKAALKGVTETINKMGGVGFFVRLINYESLHKVDSKFNFDLIIVDEAHRIGSFPRPSEAAKQLKKFVKQETKIIYLSATPTPESHSQLYHQLYITPHSPFNEYENFYSWAKEFVEVKDKYVAGGQCIKDYSHADVTKMDPLTAPFFLSYTQKQAGFDQEITEEVRYVRMKDKTYGMLNKLMKDRVIETSIGDVMAETGAKLQQKIHQMCSGTVILEQDDPDTPEGDERKAVIFDNSKAVYIRDKFAGKKIAIFYLYQAEGKLLRKIFANNTEDAKHFNSTGPEVIYIKQIQSGREGVDLRAADYIIMYNIDFSALSYLQGRARMQSKNREKKSVVIWVFAEKGLERRIYQTVRLKEDYTLHRFKYDYNLKQYGKTGKSDSGVDNKDTEKPRLVGAKGSSMQSTGMARHNRVQAGPSLFD